MAGRPLPRGYPDWETAFTCRIPIKPHGPEGAQTLWGQCWATALTTVLRLNDERAQLELGTPRGQGPQETNAHRRRAALSKMA